MNRFLIGTFLLIVIISTILLVFNAQSKQGILNDMMSKDEKKTEINAPPDKENEKKKEKEITEEAPVLLDKMEDHDTDKYTIVIDPGHQAKANMEHEPIGPNATETKPKVVDGTTGVSTKIPEYELTLNASFILKEYLDEKGFEVTLTRTENDVDISNSERADIANELEADLFLRIHADGSESSSTSGFSLLVPGQDNTYTQAIYEASQRAANSIMAHIDEDVLILGDGVFPRNDLSGFNWSKVPVVLVELGFMTNPVEDEMLANETYINELTRMIADGVEDFVLQD